MERAITFVVDRIVVPVTGIIPVMVESGIAFVLFVILWAGFGVALVGSQGSLHEAWLWVRSLPIGLQGLVWLLFLPVVLALWVWETTWPVLLRLVAVAGLAWWSLLIFVPKWLQSALAR